MQKVSFHFCFSAFRFDAGKFVSDFDCLIVLLIVVHAAACHWDSENIIFSYNQESRAE